MPLQIETPPTPLRPLSRPDLEINALPVSQEITATLVFSSDHAATLSLEPQKPRQGPCLTSNGLGNLTTKTLFPGKEKHAGSEERVRNSKTPMTKYIVGAVSSLNSHFNGIPRDVKEGLLHTVTQMNRCCRACPYIYMGLCSKTFGSPCSN